ncbi:hypothetical protein HA152_07395 [Prochlorococcus marinus XMU1412]|uniref:hypothetical protein n=1 Tax=Prochlorococcus marinus TaxID=1219 RepID=UPI001ADAE8C8|nr:hypothetical protein [Prochlorococcus marinus]MBO8240526.1 hypothetical protein [Prochlorococcus marinus XMU1412]MBW3071760.1 hypothetical protein [Prochlorococcus marinus str. MU1412]
MSITFKILKTNELENSDLNDLAKLFKDSFNKKVSQKLLLKKYLTTYKGYSYHGLFYDDSNDIIVGAYTFIPKKFKYKRKEVIGLHLQDTCFPYEGIVNPFSIKKGVFKSLDSVKKDIKELSFLYGFPNKKIESLWIKLLKWQYVNTVYTCIDLFPIVSFLTNLKIKKFNTRNVVITDIDEEQIKSRLNCFKSFHHKINENSFLALWQIHKFIPIQVIDNLNVYHDKKNSTKLITFLLRLLIPSVSSFRNKKNKKFWQLNFKMPKFPVYVLLLGDEIKDQTINFSTSFIWNDVP